MPHTEEQKKIKRNYTLYNCRTTQRENNILLYKTTRNRPGIIYRNHWNLPLNNTSILSEMWENVYKKEGRKTSWTDKKKTWLINLAHKVKEKETEIFRENDEKLKEKKKERKKERKEKIYTLTQK